PALDANLHRLGWLHPRCAILRGHRDVRGRGGALAVAAAARASSQQRRSGDDGAGDAPSCPRPAAIRAPQPTPRPHRASLQPPHPTIIRTPCLTVAANLRLPGRREATRPAIKTRGVAAWVPPDAVTPARTRPPPRRSMILRRPQPGP